MGLGQPQTTPVPSAPGLECFQVPSVSQDGMGTMAPFHGTRYLTQVCPLSCHRW